MISGFPLLWDFTVAFGDIDMIQHVNNIAYIRWIETIRCEYFARVMRSDIRSDRGVIVAQLNFTYERQLEYREAVTVGCKVSRIGNKSFDLAYEIWSRTYAHRAAHGTTVQVGYDFSLGRSIVIPDDWRAAVAAFESGPPQTFA